MEKLSSVSASSCPTDTLAISAAEAQTPPLGESVTGQLLQQASGHFRIRSTAGPPETGRIEGTRFRVHVGYWQDFGHRLYLPLVLRNTCFLSFEATTVLSRPAMRAQRCADESWRAGTRTRDRYSVTEGRTQLPSAARAPRDTTPSCPRDAIGLPKVLVLYLARLVRFAPQS